MGLHTLSELRRFLRTGRRHLDQPPQCAEALVRLTALPAGAGDCLREDQHGDVLIEYTVATPGHRVRLLSLRHP